MNNLIDYRISRNKLDTIRKSSKNKKAKASFISKFIFSTLILLTVAISTTIYFANNQKAEAVQIGLGNNYDEILKMNEEFSNNVPVSIDNISTSSVTGDKRVVALLIFLQKYKSPMASPSVAQAFIDGADRNGFGNRWQLLPAISGIESAFGKLTPYCGKTPSYNGWGWSGGGKCGRWSYFASWEDAATKISAGMGRGYRATGFDPYKIQRNYCPPCDRKENKNLWANTVQRYMNEMSAIYKTL